MNLPTEKAKEEPERSFIMDHEPKTSRSKASMRMSKISSTH
jgi:hypothetical protein